MVPSDHTQHMRKKNFIMSWFSLSLTVPCYIAYVIKFGVSWTTGNNYDVGASFFLENSHLYMSLYMSWFTTSALKRASFDKFTLTILDATYDLGPFPQKVQHSKMRMNLFLILPVLSPLLTNCWSFSLSHQVCCVCLRCWPHLHQHSQVRSNIHG